MRVIVKKMAKTVILKNFSKNVLKDAIQIFQNLTIEKPLKQKEEKSYQFKNNFFNKVVLVKKNDFNEFFSRLEVREALEKIDDFSDVVGIISGYPNTKIYSKRGLNTKDLLYSFIENYIISTNEFKFSESKFTVIFNSFLKFLNSKILQIHYFTPIFRLDFPSNNRQKDVGDIKLTKINEEQFKIIKESFVGDRFVPGYLHRLSYVLETTVPLQNDVEEEDSLAKDKFQKFLNVGHLFSEGDLKLGPIYKNYTVWMNNSSKILNMSDIHIGPRIFKLNANSIKELKKFYEEFLNLNLNNKDWSFLQVAIDRFSSSILREQPIDKIVDLNVSLECLFSSAGETSLKIANRSAIMVGPDESTQEECWNFIKNTYRLRNDILHGRKGNEIDITNDVVELEKIIRISIKKFLNLSKNLSKTDLKRQGKLNASTTIRDYLLNELDLGLINRLKLENFLKNSKGLF